MISKEEAKAIASIPGNIMGSAFLTDVENVKQMTGDEGFQKFQKAMEELGYPVEYGNIKALEWYPIGLRVLSFVVMKNIFDWKDEDIRCMGDNAPKYSFIVKIMMKFFMSPEVAFSKAPNYWAKYYSIGTLEIGMWNEQERFASVIVKDFDIHPVYCRYLEGFFRRLMQYLRPADDVRCEEIKCIFEGERYHEFKFSW